MTKSRGLIEFCMLAYCSRSAIGFVLLILAIKICSAVNIRDSWAILLPVKDVGGVFIQLVCCAVKILY